MKRLLEATIENKTEFKKRKLNSASIQENLFQKLPIGSEVEFNKLDDYLKIVVRSRILNNEYNDELMNLFQILIAPNEESTKVLLQRLFKDKYEIKESIILEPFKLIAFIFNIFPLSCKEIKNSYHVYVLDQIINYPLISALIEKTNNANRKLKLADFFNENTLDKLVKLFQKGRIDFHKFNPKDETHVYEAAVFFNSINLLCFEESEKILNEDKLPLRQLCRYRNILNATNISFFYTFLCISDKQLLQKIREYRNYDDFKILKQLLTANGISALKKQLLNFEQAQELGNHLEFVLSDSGYECILQGLLTIKDTLEISKIKYRNLPYLLSENGIIALKKGLITIDDAKKYSLAILANSESSFNHNKGLIVLEEKLLTLAETTELGNSLHFFLDCKMSLPALRKKLFTKEDLLQIKAYDYYSIFNHPNPNIFLALELKLISPRDFFEDGKYGKLLKMNQLVSEPIQELVRNYLETAYDNDSVSNTKLLQKYTRSFFAKTKLGLFHQINDVLQSKGASTKNLEKLTRVFTLTHENKIAAAEEAMEELKETLSYVAFK